MFGYSVHNHRPLDHIKWKCIAERFCSTRFNERSPHRPWVLALPLCPSRSRSWCYILNLHKRRRTDTLTWWLNLDSEPKKLKNESFLWHLCFICSSERVLNIHRSKNWGAEMNSPYILSTHRNQNHLKRHIQSYHHKWFQWLWFWIAETSLLHYVCADSKNLHVHTLTLLPERRICGLR